MIYGIDLFDVKRFVQTFQPHLSRFSNMRKTNMMNEIPHENKPKWNISSNNIHKSVPIPLGFHWSA